MIGTGTITVSVAGVYLISFTVIAAGENQFAITVNGVPVASSIYGAAVTSQVNSGRAIVTLAPGDIVNLRNNVSPGPAVLNEPNGGTNLDVNASMLFLKLA